MRVLLIAVLLVASASAQDGKPRDDAAIIAELQRQNALLRQQNELLRAMIPEPPKHHGKFVTVLQRILPVMDHAGSAASIVSVIGQSKTSKY